ncbi:MAG: DUF4350 domain-containing protein [Conexivisphaerales archaeon]
MMRWLSLGIAIGLVFSLVIVAFYPSNNDYSLQNPYWNGMSDLKNLIHPIMVANDANLSLLYAAQPPGNFILLELGPTLPYSQQDIKAISSFVSQGGSLVIADDFGSGNQLLQGLNLNIRFAGILLLDPVFNVKVEQLPLITSINIKGIRSIAFNYATYLNFSAPGALNYSANILAYSSSFSFADLRQTGSYAAGDISGPLPVIATVNYSAGRIIVISDSSLFLNSMLNQADNLALLNALISGKKPLIDTSHWIYSYQSEASILVHSVYNFIRNTGSNYAIAAVVVFLIARIKFKAASSRGREEISILRKHPDWDSEMFLRLQQERQKLRRDH